ncbi:MAG: hypothetical protein ACC682_16405, partial [Gemmatimonadota bacterium]
MTRAVAPGAFTLGWQAGELAAEYAKDAGRGEAGGVGRSGAGQSGAARDGIGQDVIEERRDLFEAILSRSGNRVSRWQEAQAAMQSIMGYYAGRTRSETMLDAGLERLRQLRQDARGELSAPGPHELYRCVEILSLMDAAEAIMVSARGRDESRFGPEHSRADHPETVDDWYCNTGMKRVNGGFTTYKTPFNHIYE